MDVANFLGNDSWFLFYLCPCSFTFKIQWRAGMFLFWISLKIGVSKMSKWTTGTSICPESAVRSDFLGDIFRGTRCRCSTHLCKLIVNSASLFLKPVLIYGIQKTAVRVLFYYFICFSFTFLRWFHELLISELNAISRWRLAAERQWESVEFCRIFRWPENARTDHQHQLSQRKRSEYRLSMFAQKLPKSHFVPKEVFFEMFYLRKIPY